MTLLQALSLLLMAVSLKQGASTCSLCFDGESITKPDHVLDLSYPVPIKTCQNLSDVLVFIEADSDLCSSARAVSTLCGCPNLPSDACTICGENMTRPLQDLDGLVDLGGVDFFGLTPTCSLVESGINVFNHGDEDCLALPMDDLKRYCDCPSTEDEGEDVGSACTLCPGGEIVPDDDHQYDFMRLTLNSVPAPNGDENIILCEDAKTLVRDEQRGSVLCNDIQRGSTACGCPVPENACELCPSGGDVTSTFERVVDSLFGIALECDSLYNQLHHYDRDSPECQSLDDSYRETCGCQKEAEFVPCTLCPDGEPVPYPDKEVVGMEGLGYDYLEPRCGILGQAALTVDENDPVCSSTRVVAKLCGCNVPETMCSICEAGDSFSNSLGEYHWTWGSLTDQFPKLFQSMKLDETRLSCELVDSFLNGIFPADHLMCYFNQLTRGASCGCHGTNATKMVALVWTQRCSGLLSFISSLAIIIFILTKQTRDRWSTYNQLVLSVSVFDGLSSTAYIFGTALTPADLGLYGSIGNEATCTFQGWLFQLGITSVYYNVLLCLYFVLVVKYNWRESKLKKLRRWVHLGVLFVGISMSLAVIPFVTADWRWCYLSVPPISESWLPGVCFFILPIGVGMLSMTFLMILFVKYVRQTESTTRRRSITRIGAPPPRRRVSLASRTFWQSLYFLAAFYAVWPIQFVAFLVPLVDGNYWIFLLAALLGPLQGFLNAMVVFYRDRKALQIRASLRGICSFVKTSIRSLFVARRQQRAAGEGQPSAFRSWLDRRFSSQMNGVSDLSSSEEHPSSRLPSYDGQPSNNTPAEPFSGAGGRKDGPDSQTSTLVSVVESKRAEPEEGDLTFEENDAILEFALNAGLLDKVDTELYRDRISSLESTHDKH